MATTLLLLEDSLTQAVQFKSHFEKLGYNVLTAPDGYEGMQILHQAIGEGEPPDLVVLDFLLPQEDGATICRRLKSQAATRAVPVLIFSGENKLRYMNEAYEAGADYYVVKGRDGFRTLELLIESILVRLSRQARRNPAISV